jgi:hypothetical protein
MSLLEELCAAIEESTIANTVPTTGTSNEIVE